ncbi:hypothetical protein vBAbaPP1_156 [Acinetobacter phage vB_AbaM_P1]|nr:hypothetical protein vBAbaPP1_156 [Acinetobacter phage vB_AbaM_P1]WAX22638.1 hypothetical protein [Acinetobacter phage vB_AbaP_HB01]
MINFKELVKNLEYISEEEAAQIIENAEINLERQIRSYPKKDWWTIKRKVLEGRDKAETIIKTLRELYVDTGKTQMSMAVVETFGHAEVKTFIEFSFARSDCDE